MTFSSRFRIFSLLTIFIASWITVSPQNNGFDTSRMDKSIDACTDFYSYSNGEWLKKLEIPAAFPIWGSFDLLKENNRSVLREILEAAKKQNAPKGTDAQLIGDFYAACLDVQAIEKAGTKPLDSYFKEIAALKNTKDLTMLIARLHRGGVAVLFNLRISADQKNSSLYIANTRQGGLSLPSREYYTKTDEDSKKLRDRFAAHISRMFELLGETPDRARENAETILKMETRLASASKTRVELRVPENYYHKMTIAEAENITPNFSWSRYAARIGAPNWGAFNLGQPDFHKELDRMIGDTSAADWKTYLRWHILRNFATRLPKKFDDEHFSFFGKTLQGRTEQHPRWRRCAEETDNAVGEALGQEYVKANFPPEAKKRMDELVTNLFSAYRERIAKLDWMTEPTKRQALAKLNAIRRKIGYPDKPRGYSGLNIDRKSYFANSARAAEFSFARDLRDINRPTDKNRWQITAPTVNAYYSASSNDIVFPAGILQPPFFDPRADDALNYGAIGAVIGHELTHGFDDRGSLYDGDGNLKMWWAPEDRKKFEEKTECLVAQFNDYEVDKGLFINGRQTLGENIADLGGLSIAYDAFLKSMEGKPRPENIDGFTPEQRFFLGYAQILADKERPEYLRFTVQNDAHSISRYRANGPLMNMPEFARAFGCQPADKMVRKNPCKVW